MEAHWKELTLGGAGTREWDEFQEAALGGTPYHRSAWLTAMAEASGYRLRSMVLLADGSWVGTLPLFERRRGFLSISISPPPRVGIPYLGPTLASATRLGPFRKEAMWRGFVQGMVNGLLVRRGPHYVRLILSPSLQDARPFIWKGFRTSPRYTYVLDVTRSPEALLESFQKDTRRLIHRAERTLTFREGGLDEARTIVEHLARRYQEQGRKFAVRPEFVLGLSKALPRGSITPFVVEEEGIISSGLLAIVQEDDVRVWQGGYRPSAPESGAVEFLYWKLATWAHETGRSEVELTGANTPTLVRFKSKFGPALRPYFVVERASALGAMAAKAHALVTSGADGSVGFRKGGD